MVLKGRCVQVIEHKNGKTEMVLSVTNPKDPEIEATVVLRSPFKDYAEGDEITLTI